MLLQKPNWLIPALGNCSYHFLKYTRVRILLYKNSESGGHHMQLPEGGIWYMKIPWLSSLGKALPLTVQSLCLHSSVINIALFVGNNSSDVSNR